MPLSKGTCNQVIGKLLDVQLPRMFERVGGVEWGCPGQEVIDNYFILDVNQIKICWVG